MGPKHDKDKKGLAFAIVLSMLALLTTAGVSYINLVNNELTLSRRHSDGVSAFYVAEAGAEAMIVYLQDIGGDPNFWGNPPSINFVGAVGSGSYNVSADTQSDPTVDITVTSAGTINGVTKTVEITFDKGPKSPFEGLISADEINLHGNRILFWGLDVITEDAIGANGSITTNSYVQINDTQKENACIPMPQFLETVEYDGITWNLDLDGDGNIVNYYQMDSANDPNGFAAYDAATNPDGWIVGDEALSDTNMDGDITTADNPYDPIAEAADYNNWDDTFDNCDHDSDGDVDEKDGYTHYYTRTLGKGQNELGAGGTAIDYPIGEGESNYYSGNTYFGGITGEYVDPSEEIVFVDGDATILFNATSWWGAGDRNLTIVSTDDIDAHLPINQPGDRLTMISYDDTYFGTTVLDGWDGFYTNVYAHDDVEINLGGRVVGTIVAKDLVDVGDLLLLNRRMFYPDKGDADEVNAHPMQNPPAGLPQTPTDVPDAYKADLKIGNKQEYSIQK
jgi:hypothetical protein